MAVPSRRQDAGLAESGRTPARRGEPGLDAQLMEHPYGFDFFQAMRVLERMQPQRRPVGGDELPGEELIRFRAYLSMAFPPSEIYEIRPPAAEGRPPEMVVAFMGLTGPSGALPRYYTEMLIDRGRQKDRTLRDFLDLFNHRLISLFYRAWEKYRYWLGYERAERDGRSRLAAGPDQYRSFVMDDRPRLDPTSDCLLNLVGLGPPKLRYRSRVRDRLEGRTAIEDETLRFYAGLLAQQHRSAVGLEGILQDYFDLSAEVIEFVGQWLMLDPENQSCLSDGGNVRLGMNVIIGERFWDVQGKFRIRLGPLNYAQFRDFLPPGTAFRPLTHLARLYAGPSLDMDVQLVLQAAEVPWCRLSTEGGAHLGWDTWIRSQEFTRDVTDAVFTVQDENLSTLCAV